MNIFPCNSHCNSLNYYYYDYYYDDDDNNNNNNNLNIFMQDCCFSFRKKTAINAGPVKN